MIGQLLERRCLSGMLKIIGILELMCHGGKVNKSKSFLKQLLLTKSNYDAAQICYHNQ